MRAGELLVTRQHIPVHYPRRACAATVSPKSMVRVDGSLSSMFTLERGVLQGSVLSPVLFLLIMDPLLKSLQSKALGPIGDTYAGAFIHADDIRTISSSRATLQEQIDTVQTFAVQNGLTLNPTKCEVVLFLLPNQWNPHL